MSIGRGGASSRLRDYSEAISDIHGGSSMNAFGTDGTRSRFGGPSDENRALGQTYLLN